MNDEAHPVETNNQGGAASTPVVSQPAVSTPAVSTSAVSTSAVSTSAVFPSAEEQTPNLGLCSSSPKTASKQAQYLECKLIKIADIEFEPLADNDKEFFQALVASFSSPTAHQLEPVLVRETKPGSPKKWEILKGTMRVRAAHHVGVHHVGWEYISAVIFVGTDKEAKFAAAEARFIRRHLNRYQLRELAAEWKKLWQALHHEHTHGGDKKKQAEIKKADGVPAFEAVVESGGAGMKKSTFYRLVADYEGGATSNSTVYGLEPTVIRPWLDSHPHSVLCNKDAYLHRLATFTHDQQKQIAPYLEHFCDPNEAYFHLQRDEAAKKGQSVPLHESFPVYHEPFWENAKRIPLDSVDAVVTDPNWELSDDPVMEYWMEHGHPLEKKPTGGTPIIKKMKPEHWDILGQLTAERLKQEGWALFLVGQTHRHEIETILRKHLKFVWTVAYIHGSGWGTPARKAGFLSHWRELLVFRRKDAPPVNEKTEFIYDLVPKVPKSEPDFETLLAYLKAQRDDLDSRIKSYETSEESELFSDLIISFKAQTMKMWHPFGQSVDAFREIVRRFTKANGFIWEPFCGGGTTILAALTCTERIKNHEGKWVWEHRPRKGIACDAIEQWVQITKWRIDTEVDEILSKAPLGKAA